MALLAVVQAGRLDLPWDASGSADLVRSLLTEREFAERLRAGERAELADQRPSEAVNWYRQAMDAGRTPLQKAYAELLLARALVKSGRGSAARPHYERLLALPSDIADEEDVPLALYAASRLLEADTGHASIAERLRAELTVTRWRAPAVAYLIRSLADTLVQSATDPVLQQQSRELHQQVMEYRSVVEQALALQRDLPKLRLDVPGAGSPEGSEPVWAVYGTGPWLVSVASPLGNLPATLVAVRSERLLQSLDLIHAVPGPEMEVEILPREEAGGESLGSQLRGLSVAFHGGNSDAVPSDATLRPSFYVVTLVLVLGITLVGTYLLWRDVRRDLRLAELRSQFVSSVSHELKTPLTAIRMFAETLRMGRAKDRVAQGEYLDTIVNESERLTRLLNNVLDFSKIERGQKTYHFEPTRLTEVVHRAASAIQYPLAQQGFHLRLHADEQVPPVRADRDALEQAILNLLSNALKYSGDGREIDLRLTRQSDHVVIEVVDRGIGIAPGEQARIFEKFYRVTTPANRAIPGTGLGLTLVNHIVEAHGGRVEVESAPGGGSTFSIRLPIEARP